MNWEYLQYHVMATLRDMSTVYCLGLDARDAVYSMRGGVSFSIEGRENVYLAEVYATSARAALSKKKPKKLR